ncbi:MAG: patatin-like phospholipase family protein [Bryobacterales bacterium]|nr:patatin-like phospholipase family protein [Bryobacterales bacterium]
MFEQVLEDELNEIALSRQLRGTGVSGFDGDTPLDKAHDAQLLGLAFSGGGIRSATFNLGVLQALAGLGMLRFVDYISTVSGGGYIGGWLAAWIRRRGFDEVEQRLASQEPAERQDGRTDPAGFLRKYSNYLTPRVGAFSADTWTMAAIWLGNTLLNFAVLATAICALLLVPRLLERAAAFLAPYAAFQTWAALTFLALAVLTAALNLWQSRRKEDAFFARPRGIVLLLVIPLFVAAWLGALRAFRGWEGPASLWHVTSWGVPAGIAAVTLATVLVVGLLGKDLSDERREWLSRVGAYLGIYTVGWSVLFGIAVYGPYLLARAADAIGGSWAASGLSAGWLLTTIGGLLAGRDPGTGDQPGVGVSETSPWKGLLAKVAPFVFIAGLLLWLSFGLHAALIRMSGFPLPGFDRLAGEHWALMNRETALDVLRLLAGCLIVTGLLSWRVDINEFSMHHLYKNRLVRCYLGASNEQRRPDRFTGFDVNDDLGLATLAPSWKEPVRRNGEEQPRNFDGPYPIVNAALNLVHGEELAWQERKAASFIFTPRYCGYNLSRRTHEGGLADPPGLECAAYRPTFDFAYPGQGIRLGTAVAISGAAASPNMGYHSSPAVAFLMTVFNVRLGWWLGNPRSRKKWTKPGPLFGLAYLLCELFGRTNDTSNYVYLSDGGHFENLGVYELVRRRCRFIIASDAGEDRAFAFENLGNAIRKCRSDLGIEIELDVDRIRRQEESGRSPWHCAVGTIHYESVDPGARPGTLVYLKSSLTGDEPSDVLEYAARCSDFPHQSTGDQWFDESQFESYRRLGLHVAGEVFQPARRQTGLDDKEGFFLALRQHWHPPSAAVERSFTRHAQALEALLERLRVDPNLQFLDAQIYPEWGSLMRRAASPPAEKLWLPTTAEELRSGFYFCNSLIQLMENVYLDLCLDREHAHPDNRGWMNLFRHWSWSGMFRVAWAISASGYGARFQTFCEQQLGLTQLKKVTLKPIGPEEGPEAAGLNFLEAGIVRKLRAEPRFARSTVCSFQISVESPLPVRDDFTFGFGFGFAVIADRRIACFRVQDHLRKMGLARLAIRELTTKRDGTPPLAVGVLPWKEIPLNLRFWSEGDHREFARLFESARAGGPGPAQSAAKA